MNWSAPTYKHLQPFSSLHSFCKALQCRVNESFVSGHQCERGPHGFQKTCLWGDPPSENQQDWSSWGIWGPCSPFHQEHNAATNAATLPLPGIEKVAGEKDGTCILYGLSVFPCPRANCLRCVWLDNGLGKNVQSDSARGVLANGIKTKGKKKLR